MLVSGIILGQWKVGLLDFTLAADQRCVGVHLEELLGEWLAILGRMLQVRRCE